jgi:diacylglycerol kinase (ATP)
MKTALIVNPRSAAGKTERRWPRMREQIFHRLGPCDVRLTNGPGHATTLTRQALTDGADLVVAIGGDGTIHEVANGFYAADCTTAIRPSAEMGVLPAGTGGDFVRTLGAARDLGVAVQQLSSAKARPIDLGRVRFTAPDGSQGVRLFINIAAFGVAGWVDHYVNRTTKAFGGGISFAVGTIRATLRYSNTEVSIAVDDQPARRGPVYNVAVANGRFFGGGMMIAPHADLSDGQFDLVTMGDISFGDLLLRGLDVYSGKHLTNPKVSVVKGSVVRVETDGDVPLSADGEQLGRLPAQFEIMPQAIKLRIP